MKDAAMPVAAGKGLTGTIFDIQKFSIHDGPGIRTAVFLKGCPLRCCWCHNPESYERQPQLSFDPESCIGCGYCSAHCERGVHRMVDDRHVLDRAACVACGVCAAGCPSGALEIVGRDITVDEAMAEVVRDRPFYEASGGGLTVSGGEPLMQIAFTEALLRRAKEEGLHNCLETCGYAEFDRLARLLGVVDLFLYDLKETDERRHIEYTGVSNGLIIDNLRRLHDAGARILLRLPTVPGVNDSPAHFAGVAALAHELPGLDGVEVLPYHRLGESKAARLGIGGDRRVSAEPPTPEQVEEWIETLTGLGVRVVNERTPVP